MKKRTGIPSTQLITTAISTTLVLLMLGAHVFFVLSARNLSDYIRENINISILISDDLEDKEIKALESTFRKSEYVKTIRYISKSEALKDATESMGTNPAEFIGFNPFTASFEINVRADYANPQSMDKIVKTLRQNSAVVDVIYQRDLIKSVNRNIQKVSLVLLIFAALFTYISFSLINNMVRLSIFSKRFIINTMKLVGAKWSFIRRPFLRNALVLGLISAVIADGALYAGYMWLNNYEPEINKIVNEEVLIAVGSSVFVFGIIITVLCTLGSLQKYLKMSTNELYHV